MIMCFFFNTTVFHKDSVILKYTERIKSKKNKNTPIHFNTEVIRNLSLSSVFFRSIRIFREKGSVFIFDSFSIKIGLLKM